MAEETKRPYTYDDATEFLEKEQLNEQMIVTDSEENGTCNIPVPFFAKADDLLHYEPVFDIFESSTCAQVSTHMRTNGKYLLRLFYNGDIYTYVKATSNQYIQLHFVYFYLGTAKFAKVVLAGGQDDPVTIVPEFEEEIQKDIYELQNGLNDTIAQFDASVDDMLDQIDRIRTSVNTKVGEEATERNEADANIESLVRESVERLEQKDAEIEETVNGKLESVAHDSTLQGDGTADNPLKVVGGGSGGGIEEAPDDGKQYARKSKSWSEVQGGVSSWNDIEDKPIEFPPTGHNHSVDDITDFPAIPTKTSDLQNDSGFINLPEDKSTERLLLNNGEWKDLVIIDVDDIDNLDWDIHESLIIDGLKYKTAKMPDGRIWTIENLQVNLPNSLFYNNDESTYGRTGKNYGRLYCWDYCAENLNVPGWHIPTRLEWETLISSVGTNPGTKLKSKTLWSSGNGSDDYEFSVLPSGYKNDSYFMSEGTFSQFVVAKEGSVLPRVYFNTDSSVQWHSLNMKTSFFSIRLIKDA